MPNTRAETEPSETDDDLAPLAEHGAALDGLLARRSVKALALPGPTDAQLDRILHAATTVPDHGNLQPWRFVVVSGDERAHFGDALVAAGYERDADLPDAVRAKLYGKAFNAPTFVVIISSVKAGKVAPWEQEASAASTGFAMVLAAHLLGLGAIWKSAPMRTGTDLIELLQFTEAEQLMGWVNLGTPAVPPAVRPPVADLGSIAARLDDGRLRPWGD